MFKILQISNKAPYPANDGSSIAIFNMAKGLIENNIELHLLTINTKKHFKPDDEVPIEVKFKSNYTSVYKNTNTSFFGAFFNLFSSKSYFISRFYFKAYKNKLIEVLKSNNFDFIQIEGLFMAIYIDVIRKNSKAKIILRAHNIEHYIWNRHKQIESNYFKLKYLSLQNKRLKDFEIKMLSKVDALVPITKIDEHEFKLLGCTKPLFTCITGVDVSLYQEKIDVKEKPKTIFYFGSMDWIPNQEAVKWFLDFCWDEIYKAVPDSKFIIAGKGIPLNFFHINKPNVLIVENVIDGKEFFLQHQVMIVPLWSGSGLRIKIIEGMSYGKAIVSTSIGAEGINYTHQKNILIADNPYDFIQSVIELLTKEDLCKNIQLEASKLALNQFDNLVVVSELVQFYKKLSHV